MNISIANRSTVLTDAAVEAALPALKHYAGLVAAGWALRTPTITFTASPPASSWQIVLLDDSDQAGALGYHDFTPGGKPIAKVFAKTDRTYGASWTVTLTHELAEMQVDPWINAAAQTSNSRFYALEVGDPVEDDALAFDYLGVKLSDFVLPAWFQPGARGPFSHAGHATRPLHVLAGGYAQYFENGRWTQVGPNGQHQPLDPDDQRLRSRWS